MFTRIGVRLQSPGSTRGHRRIKNPHQNARLAVYSREQIVPRIAAGRPAAEVADAFGVSVRMVGKWVASFRADGRAELSNRASPPARVASRLLDRFVKLIVWLRRALRLTAARIAARLGVPRATVARWLRRSGLGKPTHLHPPEPVRRYQRDRPGGLIQLDIKKLVRFDRPEHRITGTRRGCRYRGAGWNFVHVAVDDATRLACVEVLPDEREASTTAFLLRALRWFHSEDIETEQVMTDNGSAYRSRRFRKALRCLGIPHIFTRPYRPKTNGKAERFIQTLLREWACGLMHPSSDARNAELSKWLDWFNRSIPHSALKGLPPILAANILMINHI